MIDSDELMSPDENTNFKSTDGKLSLALPTSDLLISGVSFYFGNFPLTRLLVMLLAAILLGFHPSKNVALLFGTTTLGLIGLLLLKDWSSQPNFGGFGVVVGSIFLCSSVILAPVASKIARKRSMGDAAVRDCKSTTGEMPTD